MLASDLRTKPSLFLSGSDRVQSLPCASNSKHLDHCKQYIWI